MRWALWAAVLASSVAFLDSTIVPVALPAMQAELGLDEIGARWVVEAYLLPLAALLLVSGTVGDRLGRARVLRYGVAAFAAASLACALAPTGTALIAARAVQGLAAAAVVPNSLALLGAAYREDRGRAVGTWTAATSAAVVLGPPLGGVLTDAISWRAIFAVNIPVAAVTLWLLHHVEEAERTEARLDVAGAVTGTIGLGALVAGLLEAGRGHPWAWPVAAAGVVLLVVFAFLQRRRGAMVPTSLFADRTFTGANVATVLLYGALTALSLQLPLMWVNLHGHSATAAGLMFLPTPLLLMALARHTGATADRHGARLPFAWGSILVAAGCAWLAWGATQRAYWPYHAPGLVLVGLGLALAVPVVTAAVLGAVPPRRVGTASAVNNAAARVGGLLAVAVLGLLAVAVAQAALTDALADTGLEPDERDALVAQEGRVATRSLPEGLDAGERQEAEAALHDAAVGAFRAVFVACAALAAAAAATARLLGPR